ncbi:LPS-assembly protein LptD [Variovorax sp. HJSM1_2]|uniref:LPS-assembly protein LptD n=1 Tax=Variovorax sp. HJSM1_2 TaxID=3366263 RepID=UPI003BC1D373
MSVLKPYHPPANGRARFARTPVAVVAALLCMVSGGRVAHAQAADDAPLRLRTTPLLAEQVPAVVREQSPTFYYGDKSSGQAEQNLVLEGNAVMRKSDMVMRADRMEYTQVDDMAKASGNVYVNRGGNIYTGERLELKVDAFEGFFEKPTYQFLANGGQGDASRAEFLDDKRLLLRDATYSTCRREGGPSWMPDWILKARTLNIDMEDEVGVAEGGVLRFKDVPVLAFPEMSFPLTDKRKSGFLPPTVGLDNLNGFETTVPYYWNIAPNRDATFFPTVMTKRGIDLGAEFRYLEPTYNGTLRGSYMPDDRLRDRERWSYAAKHSGSIDTGISGVGKLGLNLNLNRVSDDNYWSDFGLQGESLTERLLANEGSLAWASGNFSTSIRALKWQTLQDAATPIVPPYDRMPQWVGRYARYDVGGFDYALDADYTQFQADKLLTLQPNAQRSFLTGQISRPWLAPGWFVTPKLMFSTTNYQFDQRLANGMNSATVTVPTFSLDTGLIFERNTNLFGKNLTQTLEPRAFYVNTPYRDQNFLPVYDAAQNDFNFATVFTENAFSGHDRISDSNLLTLGLTTRFLNADTAEEYARFGVAQRVRFKDQLVTMPGVAPVTDRLSDFLVGASVNWDKRWSTDATVQYNQKTNRSERALLSGRWSPSDYRSISAAYRYRRDQSESVDVSWQWPLNDLWGDKGKNLGPGRGQGEGRWYSVGRLNYSLQENKLVDSVMGFEYDAGCWLGRIVIERLQRSTDTVNQKILFQIEFVGFARLGASPLAALRENIPRYQYLRENTTTPSRFGQYD